MMLKKLSPKHLVTIFAIVFAVASFAFSPKAHAGVLGWVANQLFPASDNFDWTNSMLAGIGSSMYQPLIGCTYKELSDAENEAAQTAKITSCSQGGVGGSFGVPAVQVTNNYLYPSLLGIATTLAVEGPQRADLYPVNLAVYVNDIKNDSIIFPKTAYASGWADIVLNSTILSLWRAMRNLAYLLFVIILVVFGFMVMFRYKINPQTVITVQSALPKVVIGLLLITFSWPIGVLALQLMALLSRLAWTTWPLQADLISTIIVTIISSVVNLLALFTPLAPIAFTKIIVGLVLIIAFFLAIISGVISIFTRLARIMLMVTFAPIQFAIGALPGRDDTVAWFKQLLANVLAVPAISFMLVIGIGISFFSPVTQFNSGGDPVSRVVMMFLGQFVGMIIGLWFMWNARNAPKYIEKALQVGGGWVPGSPPKPGGRK